MRHFLTDLLKAFYCIYHKLLIAKTLWKGRFIVSLKNNFSYLKHKTQSNKINDCFSARSNFENGIPQGSILGQLLLYINMINLFFECEENDIANYVDDRSPHSLSS